MAAMVAKTTTNAMEKKSTGEGGRGDKKTKQVERQQRQLNMLTYFAALFSLPAHGLSLVEARRFEDGDQTRPKHRVHGLEDLHVAHLNIHDVRRHLK
jgi:hypothetical protein